MRALVLSALLLCAAAPPPGGLMSFRFGMTAEELAAAYPKDAHDIVFVPASADGSRDDATLALLPVMTPWDDAYVAKLDPTTRLQVNLDGGRVVAVFLRQLLLVGPPECHERWAVLERGLAARYGTLQVTEAAYGNPLTTTARGRFPGWTLAFDRLSESDERCSLTTDAVSDADAGAEARWRKGLH